MQKVDDTVVEVIKLKSGAKKFMRKTTANSKFARRFYKVLRELTPKEVEEMHELTTPEGDKFEPLYENVVTQNAEVKGSQVVNVTGSNIEEKAAIMKQLDDLGITYRKNTGIEKLKIKLQEAQDGTK